MARVGPIFLANEEERRARTKVTHDRAEMVLSTPGISFNNHHHIYIPLLSAAAAPVQVIDSTTTIYSMRARTPRTV